MVSCTREIGIVKFHSPDKSKQGIVLIDTPGFTHDHLTDAEVLNIIADFLSATYVALFIYESPNSAGSSQL